MDGLDTQPCISSSRSPITVASESQFKAQEAGSTSGAVVSGEAPESTMRDIWVDKCRSLAKSLVFSCDFGTLPAPTGAWSQLSLASDAFGSRPPLEKNELSFGWEKTQAFPSRRGGAGGVLV